MSDDPNFSNLFTQLNNFNQFLLDELIDDTDEKIFMSELEAEAEDEAESSNRVKNKRKYIDREREAGDARLFKDYFSSHPTYTPEMFRRRYRMSIGLFTRIVEALSNHSEYFRLKCDATGRRGLSPQQKCIAAIHQLAYGTSGDEVDEYVRLAETTALDCLNKFCRCIVEVFGNIYLRRPNAYDIQRLLQLHSEKHGFPGMLGSIDCMHWQWKNCPVAWKGQFTRGDQGVPTIMLEAVASQDLWIWHAFFGVAGSNNDINVLNQSTLFNEVLEGSAPEVQFMVNGTQYTKGYYLADGIYPEWATLVKSFSYPEDPKRKKFKQMQEAARKDVERAFGVLQSRWAIVRGATRLWDRNKIKNVMYACIILHNMIVENEGHAISDWSDENGQVPQIPVTQGSTQEFEQYIQRHAEIRDRAVHNRLRADLVEHIWERFGGDDYED